MASAWSSAATVAALAGLPSAAESAGSARESGESSTLVLPYTASQPAKVRTLPSVRKSWPGATVETRVVTSNSAAGWNAATKRRAIMS